MTEVVINACFGGFGLSHDAVMALAERKGVKLHYEKDWFGVPRDDPDLVAVVRELGDKANGGFAKLRIVKVPDDAEWEIAECDGSEHVAETHRTWS